jgi:hypothetical protein
MYDSRNHYRCNRNLQSMRVVHNSLSSGLFGVVSQLEFKELPVRSVKERFLHGVHQLRHSMSRQRYNGVPSGKSD